MKPIVNKLKKTLQGLLFQSGYYAYRLKKNYGNHDPDDHWKARIEDAIACDDNKDIPRVSNAGQIIGNTQVMHNGLRIKLGSYYGSGLSEMLTLNKGVHEPQEEKVFGEVLKYISDNAVMIELGSYWSFYSMWFNSKVKNAKCYMIEPDIIAFHFGKSNFKLNKMKGDFTNAFISSRSSLDEQGNRTICLDDFVKDKNITSIAVLHSDIQGFEFEMLKGATQCFDKNMVSYVFISTHSELVHKECLDFLTKYNFSIISAADLSQTYSVDGLIAAKAPFIHEPDKITVDLKLK